MPASVVSRPFSPFFVKRRERARNDACRHFLAPESFGLALGRKECSRCMHRRVLCTSYDSYGANTINLIEILGPPPAPVYQLFFLPEERAHLGERGRSGQNTNERDDQTVQSRDRTAGRKASVVSRPFSPFFVSYAFSAPPTTRTALILLT
jgi:hypothetical protein